MGVNVGAGVNVWVGVAGSGGVCVAVLGAGDATDGVTVSAGKLHEERSIIPRRMMKSGCLCVMDEL